MDLFKKSKENKLQTLKNQLNLLLSTQEGREESNHILEKQIEDIDKKIMKLKEQKEKLLKGIDNNGKSRENVSKQIIDLKEKIHKLEFRLKHNSED